MTRRRADIVIAERGLLPSREQARAAILAGEVKVDGRPVLKAGETIDVDAQIEVASRPRFVSRGGLKLEGALRIFGIDPTGLRVADVGASTGGFTDCLLQHGAHSVAAIDVGYGQLAWSLRQDPRVHVHERTNIRSADPVTLGAPFDLVVVDVSFIGLLVVVPALLGLLIDSGEMLSLVKPQFEVGKGRVGKRGVVKDPALHEEVLKKVVEGVREAGLRIRGVSWSPIVGPEGNIEFWLWASRSGQDIEVKPADVVRSAHAELGG